MAKDGGGFWGNAFNTAYNLYDKNADKQISKNNAQAETAKKSMMEAQLNRINDVPKKNSISQNTILIGGGLIALVVVLIIATKK